MTKNTVNEKERMVITRVFDAPRALVWKAWTDPQYVMQWWGQEGWNGGEYHEIVPHEKIVYSLYFADSKGNKVEPAQYGIEHEAIDDARDVVIFEDFGNGQTKLTMIGNETMEDAKNSGQLEGWNQILEKVAAVIAGLAQAK